MIKIFIKLKEEYIKTEMEYTFNFWMMIISGVVMQILMLAIPFIIYKNIPMIYNWSEEEVYLIMIFLIISEGVCNILFEGVWQLPSIIFSGQIDTILTRPIPPLVHILSYGLGLQGIGTLLFGLVATVVLFYSMNLLNLKTIFLFLLFIICGTVLRMSIYLMGNSIAFWIDTRGAISLPVTIGSIGEFAKYPIDIYPRFMKMILLMIIPYAFLGYIPMKILKGEYIYLFLLIGITGFFWIIARMIFYIGIQHYESPGS